MEPQKQSLKKSTFRWSIGTQLYLIIAIFVLLIFFSGLLGWNSIHEMNDIQKSITKERIPELSLAIKIGQESVALSNLAPKLLTADSEDRVAQLKNLNRKNAQQISAILIQLKQTHPDQTIIAKYESHYEELINNLDLLETSVIQTLKQKQQLKSMLTKSLDKAYDINRTLISEVDKQTFFLQTGWKSLRQKKPVPLAQRAKQKSLNYYRSLLELKAQTQLASGLINQSVQLSNPDLIQPLRERFRAALGNCKQSLLRMENNQFRKNVFQQIQDIEKIGLGSPKSKGLFGFLESIFKQTQLQKEYLASNQNAANNLSSQTQQLINNIEKIGLDTTKIFEDKVDVKKVQFTMLNLISLVLAFITTFFLIGKLFLTRIRHLSQTILTMSEGNLEAPLNLKGNDEISDIGKAMEVFRQYALEVQKLNLVQKLAKEVQDKNTKLEGTINQLKKAQQQIVMQEKLASLGQLTSGIAHEIKNPLNFINNFSKISQELLEDLSRELVEPENNLSKQSQSFIEEVLADLHSNMDKINSHGQRANDIITGMLRHSRSNQEGVAEAILFNPFLNSCINLAYQGKRAAGSKFNVDFKKDYDDNIGEAEINPQDISRVIINLVTNAYDALEEKSKKLSEQEKANFSPCIWIQTRKNGETLEIRVGDNGPGIPQDNFDKIFNPFFTTKSTDKGTGLGLSLSYDIVYKYGGQLKAGCSMAGGAEFIMELPFKASQQTESEEDTEATAATTKEKTTPPPVPPQASL